MLGVVIQIDAYDPVAATNVTIQASSVDDPAVCHINGQTWWPAIAKLPTLKYDFFDGSFSAKITAPSSSLTLQLEPWSNFGRYQLADARLRLWAGEIGTDWATWGAAKFDGRVSSQPEAKDGVASIDFAVDDKWLDQAMLSLYAGTTGAEGPASIKGQAKPLALGAPRYVPGKLIDVVNSVFQVSSYGAVNGFEAALERLARFSAPTADYATYAALIAATIPAGKWATAKAVGMARFGAPPAGQISFLLQGDAAGTDGWARKPGQLIRRLAILSGGAGKIDDASLNALDFSRPYNLSVYLETQTTARDLIQKIAASVNAVAVLSWTGKLFLLPIGVGAPTMTFAADGSALPPVESVQQVSIDPPFKKLSLSAERSFVVHDLGDVAFTAPLLPVGAYNPATTYREGNIADLPDGSRWLFVANVPSAGNAPVAGSSYWSAYSPSTVVNWGSGVSGAGKPQDNATLGATLGTTSGASNIYLSSGGAGLTAGQLVTDQGTAAAIAGQGFGATAAQNLVDNRVVPVGTNQVVNSAFQRGTYGWSTLPGTTLAYDAPGYVGVRHLLYADTPGVLASGAYKDVIFIKSLWAGANTLADSKQFAMKVKPGQRFYYGALTGVHNCTATLFALVFDASGNLITAPSIALVQNFGGANGDPSTMQKAEGYFDVPANSAMVTLMFRIYGDGSNVHRYVFVAEPKIGIIPSTQTAIPEYVDGPIDPIADRTLDNTAGGIVGQSEWATTPRGVNAVFGPNTNLLYNGSMRLGTEGWSQFGGWGLQNGSYGEGNYWVNYSSGTAVATSASFSIAPGVGVTLQAELFAGGVTAGSCYIRLAWLNASGANIGYSPYATAVNGSSWTLVSAYGVAPANTTKAVLELVIDGPATNTAAAGRKFKVAGVNYASTFTDEATNGAIYGDGQSIRLLQPTEAMSNRTETRVAAAFLGQTGWATYPVSTRAIYAPGSNMMKYPRPILGLSPAQIGWVAYNSMASGAFFPAGVNDYSPFGGPAYYIARNVGDAGTAQGYFDIPIVQDGNGYTVSFTSRTANGTPAHYIGLLDATRGNEWGVVNMTPVTDGITGVGTTRYKASITNVAGGPANVLGSWIRIHVGSNFAALSAGGYQDIYWYDVKCEQGYEATPIGQTSVPSISSANMLYYTGATAESLRPGEFNANNTEGRTAAAIFGQAPTATNSDFAVLTGPTKPQNNADVTANSQSSITYFTAKSIPADYTGTIAAGVLPTSVGTPYVIFGGVNISGFNNVSYFIQNQTGGCVGNVSIDNTNGSANKGVQTIGTGFNATGTYEIYATINGYLQPIQKVTVTKVLGSAPSGGGGTATSGNFDSSGFATTSTTLAEVGRVPGIVVAAGKTLRAYFNDDYFISFAGTTVVSRNAVGRWEYSPTGANSWIAMSSNVSGSTATYQKGDSSSGSITSNPTATPAAGTYDARFMLGVNSAMSSGSLTLNGGTQSVVAN